MSETNGTTSPTTIDEYPQSWQPPSVLEAFTAGMTDTTAGLPEYPGELPFFNRDLEEKVFVFASQPVLVHEDEKTVGGKTISAQDVVYTSVAVFNPAIDGWDPIREAKLNGGWLVPQIMNLTYLQLTTRPWTLRKNPEKTNSPWMLARPDREQLSFAGTPATTERTEHRHFQTVGEFVKAIKEIGYGEAEVCEKAGVTSLYAVNWDEAYVLLQKQKGLGTARENVTKGKTPKVHA